MALSYVQPQEFQTGQVLGRGQLGILVDNDQFFSGLCDAYLTVPRGVERTWIGTETTLVVFDGYHWLQADAETVYYFISVTNVDPAHRTTLTLTYDGTTIGTTNSGDASGTYDASAKASGLYRVVCTATRGDGDYGATMYIRPPYTIYTGARSYTAVPTITDGNVGTAAEFNIWRANDLYFNDMVRPNPAFVSVKRGFVGDEESLSIWQGWVKHDANHTKLNYKVAITEITSDAEHIHLTWGGATVATITSAGDSEGSATISGTPGAFYEVEAVFERTAHDYHTVKATIYYLFTRPNAADAGFTNMGALTVGQDVYGDTAGQDTRLQLLSDNDDNLNGRTDRLDYTVHKAWYDDLGDAEGDWDYYLMRRYDTLIYRGTNVTITYGDDDTVSLDDTDDGDNIYRSFDLGQITGLMPGQIYKISGGTLHFACEV